MWWIDYWPLPWTLYTPLAVRILVGASLAFLILRWFGGAAARASPRRG